VAPRPFSPFEFNGRAIAGLTTNVGLQGCGIVIADGAASWRTLPLPAAGLMSDHTLAEVHHWLRSAVSLLALPVKPEPRITNRELVNVARFELVPLPID
jgi:adenine deaminase